MLTITLYYYDHQPFVYLFTSVIFGVFCKKSNVLSRFLFITKYNNTLYESILLVGCEDFRQNIYFVFSPSGILVIFFNNPSLEEIFGQHYTDVDVWDCLCVLSNKPIHFRLIVNWLPFVLNDVRYHNTTFIYFQLCVTSLEGRGEWRRSSKERSNWVIGVRFLNCWRQTSLLGWFPFSVIMVVSIRVYLIG